MKYKEYNDSYSLKTGNNDNREETKVSDPNNITNPRDKKRSKNRLLKSIDLLFLIAIILGSYFAYKYVDEHYISQNPYKEEQTDSQSPEQTGSDSNNKNAGNNGPSSEDLTEVQVTTISDQPLKRINFQKIGTAIPYKSSTITAEASGNISGFDVNEGENVNKGAILAKLSDSVATDVADISYDNAQTLLEYARQSLSNVENSVNQSLENAKIGVETAELNYKNALLSRENLEKTLDEQQKAAMLGVQSAEIGLQAAQENYFNSLASSSVTLNNTISQALSGIVSALTLTDSALDSINVIFEDPLEDPIYNNVSNTALYNLKDDLEDLENKYEDLFFRYEKIKNANNMERSAKLLEDTLQLLQDLQSALYDTKSVLNEAIDEREREDIIPVINSLIALKTTANTLLTAVDQSKGGLNQSKSALDGALISANIQPSGAFSAMEAAEVQLTSAREGVLQTQAAAKSQLDAATHAINMSQKQLESAVVTLNTVKSNGSSQGIAAKTQVAQLEGQINLLAANLGGQEIKSPVAGILLEKFVEDGNYINPGQKIATIADMRKVKVKVSLTIEELSYVKLGQDVIISSPSGNETKGKITKILPKVDVANKKIEVEIIIPNENGKLLANVFVDVQFPDAQKDSPGMYIPFKAVIFEKNTPYVFTVHNGKAIKTEIEISDISGNVIEVISGLNLDDVVIIEGAKLVNDGQRVKITN